MSIKIGIIGTGYIAEAHIAALQKLTDAKVAAVAGRNGKRASELAAIAGANAYDDIHQMFQKENLDAAFILLPPNARGEVERECAAHVPAVLIEKPVSNNLKQATELANMFRSSGTLVSVAYMMRYQKAIERAHTIFQKERPVLVSGRWTTPAPAPRWWRDKSLSGGQFVEQCTHLVDAARYLVGDIVTVSAFGATGFVTDIQGYDVDDAMVVNVLFESGAVGNFHLGCFPREETGPEDISLYVASRNTSCDFSGWGMGMNLHQTGGYTEHFEQNRDSIFEIEDAAFLEAVKTRNPSLIRSSYDDGVRTLAVTLAANESRIKGRPITL